MVSAAAVFSSPRAAHEVEHFRQAIQSGFSSRTACSMRLSAAARFAALSEPEFIWMSATFMMGLYGAFNRQEPDPSESSYRRCEVRADPIPVWEKVVRGAHRMRGRTPE